MSCYIQSGVRLTPENKRISTDDDDDDDVVRHVVDLRCCIAEKST